MMANQRPHFVTATWVSTHGELEPTIHVRCPYEPDDFAKPCRIWANGFEDDGQYEPGCWVLQTLDAVGWGDMSFVIPDGSEPPWPMLVTGFGDDDPGLTHIELVRETA